MIKKISLRKVEEKEVEEFLDRAFYDEALTVWAKQLVMDEKTDDLRLIAQLKYIMGRAKDAVAEEWEAE